jgi:hypothetical protein
LEIKELRVTFEGDDPIKARKIFEISDKLATDEEFETEDGTKKVLDHMKGSKSA